LPGLSDTTAGPSGDSALTITIASAGGVTLSGVMADGTVISQTSQLSQEGYYPLYVPLYAVGANGSVIGWLNFDAVTTNSLGTNSIVTWFNDAGATALYASGFTNQSMPIGSLYQTNLANLLTSTTATVIVSGGNLTASLTNTVTISNNVITATPLTNGLSLSLNRSTGAIQGTFVDPDSGHTNLIYGSILQGADACPGFFIGTTEAGEFILTGD
jgi:hypothetical protein